MILETNSPQETFSAGRQLGEKAFPGQVITLTADLGVGKTVFTQGLAKGLGIEEPVNSPTFTIVQVYDEGRLPLYMKAAVCHFITLMCTGSGISKRWMKWDLKNMLWATVFR